jgi:3-deoxy-D-manno-octulosonate 8-phosphate phosphatase (KDO 8-P phosphatase)
MKSFISINNKIIKKVKNIKFFACDVDGVLTHGEIIILESNEEIKIWNVKDGFGYRELLKTMPKIKTAWITAGKSNQVKKRADDIGIDYVFQNCTNKIEAINKIAKKEKLNLSEIAYIGDDIVDISVLSVVGFSVCPLDASEDVKNIVDYISKFNGGYGVVREIIEIIMKINGMWVINKYK